MVHAQVLSSVQNRPGPQSASSTQSPAGSAAVQAKRESEKRTTRSFFIGCLPEVLDRQCLGIVPGFLIVAVGAVVLLGMMAVREGG